MTRNTLIRSFTADRRRLIEARIAHECEALRQERLMDRAMQESGRAGADRAPRTTH